MGSNLFGIGIGELIFLVILALIIFGPKRIPEVARTIGRFLQQVRKATSGIEGEVRQLMEGQGDPATWLTGEPPAPPRPVSQAMPYTPFVPPQRPDGGLPSTSSPSTLSPEGQSEEPSPPAPAPSPAPGESEPDTPSSRPG